MTRTLTGTLEAGTHVNSAHTGCEQGKHGGFRASVTCPDRDTSETLRATAANIVPTSARVCHMSIRTARVGVNLTPELMTRLERYAAHNHWTMSTASAVLIEHGLDQEEREVDSSDDGK